MFCPKCGTRLDDNAAFCSGCGTRMDFAAMATEAAGRETSVSKIKKVFGSGIFLAIAIISTINVLSGVGANILSLLTTIAMWVIYGAAKSEKHTCLSGLKFSHGILKAKYIINWVGVAFAAIALAVILVLNVVLNQAIREIREEMNRELEMIVEEIPDDFDMEKSIDELLDEVYSDPETVKELKILSEELDMDLSRDSVEEFVDKFAVKRLDKGVEWLQDNKDDLFTSVFDKTMKLIVISVAAELVALIFYNIFVIGRLQKFARSICKAVEAGDTKLIDLKLVRSALVAMGVITLLGGCVSLAYCLIFSFIPGMIATAIVVAVSTPLVAAACFVSVAFANKLRAELAE